MFLGTVAGLIGSVAGLIVVYVVSVLVIFVKSQDVLATLLAAFTFLPLMLILVLFLPNLILGILIGLVLGAMGFWRSRLAGFAVGMVIGFICAELMLSFILPDHPAPAGRFCVNFDRSVFNWGLRRDAGLSDEQLLYLDQSEGKKLVEGTMDGTSIRHLRTQVTRQTEFKFLNEHGLESASQTNIWYQSRSISVITVTAVSVRSTSKHCLLLMWIQ